MANKIPTGKKLEDLLARYPDIPAEFFTSGVIRHTGRTSVEDQYRILCLRLEQPALSVREIADKLGTVSHMTVQTLVKKAVTANLVERKTTKRRVIDRVEGLKVTQDRILLEKQKLALNKANANDELASMYQNLTHKGLAELLGRDLSEVREDHLIRIIDKATANMRLLRDEATKKVMTQTHTVIEHVAFVEALPLEQQLAIADGEEKLYADAELAEITDGRSDN